MPEAARTKEDENIYKSHDPLSVGDVDILCFRVFLCAKLFKQSG